MSRRGRLIFPILVTVKQLDVATMRTATDYDDVLREPELSASADRLGTKKRTETTIDVPCQLEEKDASEKLTMMAQGDAPSTQLHITFHVDDLERLGLWKEDAAWGARCSLKKNDRIEGFKDLQGRQLFKVPENPGLFITEVRPTGMMGTQNLVLCVVNDRSEGAV